MTAGVAAPHAEAPVLLAAEGAHERHFGNIDFQSLRLNTLLDLSQIRPEGGMQLEKLQESIDNDDLDNPLNLARCSREELTAYIDFTNKTWGTDRSIEEFDAYQQDDLKYNLVVGGHRRLYSIRNIAERYELEHGVPTDYTVLCKVMPEASVGAIVSKQAAENLHKGVPQEREAMAVVELYHWGLQDGQWTGPEAFYAANKARVSRRMLKEALIFTGLSYEVQHMVFSRAISYNAGLALGEIVPLARDWAKAKVGLTRDDLVSERLSELMYEVIETRIRGMSGHIQHFKLNSTASIKYIQGAATKMAKEITEAWGEPPEDTLFDLAPKALPMKTAEEQAEDLLRVQQRELEQIIRELHAAPLQQATQTAIILAAGSTVLADIKASNDLAERHIVRTLATQLEEDDNVVALRSA